MLLLALSCLLGLIFLFFNLGSIAAHYDEKNKFSFSLIQSLLFCITSIIVVIFVWKLLPIHNIIKLCILLSFGSFILWIVISFAAYISRLNIIRTSWQSVIITILMFLAVPVLLVVTHNIHEKEYLTSYPDDNQISVQITYEINRVNSSGSIGHDWTYHHFLNNQEFESGDIVTINAKSPFSITSRFVEHDSISDVGESSSKQYKYSQNDNYKKTLTISQKVHVTERGGRKYAGSTADFNVTYTLKRVVPPSIGFWGILLYTSNSIEFFVCISLIVLQILCIIFVVFVIINGKKKDSSTDYPEQKNENYASVSNEKDLHQYDMLEPVLVNVDEALSVTSESSDVHCSLIAETPLYEFFRYRASRYGFDHVLRREKASSPNVVYFGYCKSMSCTFHNYLFQADHWVGIHKFYIYCKNITTGEIREFDWLGKGWVIGPFHHLYCQDSIDTMYTDGEKLIIKVTRRKSDPNHTKNLTPSQQKFDYDTPYRIEVVYEDGKFRCRSLFPRRSNPPPLLNPPENS